MNLVQGTLVDAGWLKEQTRLANLNQTKRIGVMWAKHGRRDANRCRTCRHFVKTETPARRRHSKCNLFGISRGPATDWNGAFVACGQWKEGQ